MMLQTEKAVLTATPTRADILTDYRTACESRQASLLGRKEVFMGKAKFGIFGDGKELPQLAMARAFRNGDFRAGYYRDQTFMFATGLSTLQQYFAQLYAHADLEAEPSSGGRLMNGHFSTRMLDEKGLRLSLTDRMNSSSDVSPTAAQMPRLLGMAYASKLFRQNPELNAFPELSINGNEVAFGTIGNASTSEGLFYETINAAGVLQVPMLISVWDDEYGISVPKEYHTTHGSISDVLSGFRRRDDSPGFEIFTVNGWDYEALIETYTRAAEICRTEHVPVLVHVQQLTQPQGHSTSGSHERYKSEERLAWEAAFDCNLKMREWILENGIANEQELEEIEKQAAETARKARTDAWNAFLASVKAPFNEANDLLSTVSHADDCAEKLHPVREELSKIQNPIRADSVKAIKKALRALNGCEPALKAPLKAWLKKQEAQNYTLFNGLLHSESPEAVHYVNTVAPVYTPQSAVVDGREVLKACFEAAFTRDPLVFAIGEDVGKIGDVNQGFAGLQEMFGEIRVTDTGIREATIIGQGIGAALRGLRPIAEIQYLDYLLYALQTLSDDLATLQYRTAGGQKAPLIVRTRGHRLEGMWHAGSPMGMILGSLRGMHVLVPRNMTQAAAFYNTLLACDEPALLIECLNGYRLKERLPENISEIMLPLGVPEVIREGADLTIVTYGSMCRIAAEAAAWLEKAGADIEIIDVQTLLPFDINSSIAGSLKKTNRVIFADEDVPGGATAFMMQQVLDGQDAWKYLDSKPVCISAKAHRPAYSSDGDYFSKPSADDLFDAAWALLNEAEPDRFGEI
ncbi:MAG: thiamine pyrophosphate-dependent enzyme [Bacteroidota bacterium]